MQIEDIKRWQWVLVGLLIGGILAGSRLFYGYTIDTANRRNSGIPFETMIVQPAPLNVAHMTRADFRERQAPYFGRLIVHPPQASESSKVDDPLDCWIEGYVIQPAFKSASATQPTTPPGEQFVLRTPVPYIPQKNYVVDKAPGLAVNPHFDQTQATQYWDHVQQTVDSQIKAGKPFSKAALATMPTVMTYIQQLNDKYPSLKVPVRYQWTEVPWVVATMWIVGSVLVVGVFWPELLGLLLGAGLGRLSREEHADKEMEKYMRSRPAPAPVPVPTYDPALLEEDVEARIAALEGDAAAKAAAYEASITAPPPVPTLSGRSEPEPKPEEKPQPVKTFGTAGGAYYPTEVHIEKKE
jgi:hypothetical protein